VKVAIKGVLPKAQQAQVVVEHQIQRSSKNQTLTLGDTRICIQVLTNLLLNAIAFSERGSSVLFEACPEASGVRFVVQDQGPGIPLSKRSRIFARVRSTREGGAGIGLSHSKALAERYAGELNLVDSVHGARFELLWPWNAIPSATPSKRRPLVGLEGQKVLLVEDDAAVLILLETTLGNRGVHVTCARTSEEFYEALAGGPFDAALVDLSPISGEVETALQLLKQQNKKLNLVVISGSVLALPDEVSGLVNAWVRKPFDLSEIVEVLMPQSVAPPA
jgi:CheY-like chemotaxis protein